MIARRWIRYRRKSESGVRPWVYEFIGAEVSTHARAHELATQTGRAYDVEEVDLEEVPTEMVQEALDSVRRAIEVLSEQREQLKGSLKEKWELRKNAYTGWRVS